MAMSSSAPTSDTPIPAVFLARVRVMVAWPLSYIAIRKDRIMLVDIHCSQGQLQLGEDGTLCVMTLFKKLVWQLPAEQVRKFITQPGKLGMLTIHIQTAHETKTVETVAPQSFEKLKAAFPQVPVSAVQGKEWYHDFRARSRIATYTNEKQMNKEAEAAFQQGWMIQGTSGTAGHVNVGRTMTKLVLTGGIGLMTGASRSKDKLTITFVRTLEWVAQNP